MNLPIRALLYDLARNQRAHLPFLESVIDRLARLGFNMLVINLEHRFEFKSCPGVCPTGSLTAAGAKRLVAYGRRRGIAVVPQPNLAGHCEGMAATERYAHLSADPHTQAPYGGYEQLNLELPSARQLARRMLADVCRAFPCEYLHIGCDEVRRMEYLFPGDPHRQQRALKRQFAFLLRHARRTGRQIMIWGDMLLKHPELLKSVPRDVIICDWHYNPEGSRATLRHFKQKGYRVVACPAVPTYEGFLADPDLTRQNITRMISDARSLALDGFLLTSWEFGFGSAFDTVWPWVELAADVAAGKRPRPMERRVARIHRALCGKLKKILAPPGSSGFSLVRVRKALFRAANPSGAVVRPVRLSVSGAASLYEPSPFEVWLYLRPILTPQRLRRFKRLSQQVTALARTWPYRATARALAVLSDRLEHLDRAKRAYHTAAQGRRFPQNMRVVIRELQALRPGLRVLKGIVRAIDARQGLDPGELRWLEIHERSLDEHIAAVRRLRPNGEPLLEFGEFLRRPASISQRLTWR